MKFKTNKYNYTKMNCNFLLVNKTGKWIFLTEENFNKFNSGNVDTDSNLFNNLKKQEFLCGVDCEHKFDFPVKKYSFLCQGPTLHIIILTDLCNLNCVYCQASSLNDIKTAKKMDGETAKKTIDFIFQSTSKNISIEFQGGEPLLNFDIIQYIIEYAKNLNLDYKKNLNFAFTTNFQLLDEEKLLYLIRNKVGLCTSLDGPKELHDSQRKSFGKSNHDIICYWIERIKQLKDEEQIPQNYKAHALITVTKESLKYPKEIVDEYVKLGFDVIHPRHLNKIGVAKKTWKQIGYSAEEFVNFWKKTMDYIIELNKKNIWIKERLTLIILKKILWHFEPNYTELRSPCGACISQLVYSPEGNVYSCDEGRMLQDNLFKIGNIHKKQSGVIINENSLSIIMSSINDLQQCDDCVWQPYCGLCPVLNYAEFGSLIVDVNKTMRCKIFKETFRYIFEKILFDEEAKNIFIKWLESEK